MGSHIGYRIGQWICLALPRPVSYWIARRAADVYSAFARKDREAVRGNLAVVLGTGEVPPSSIREVFRNFAMYLVDFFRFGNLTTEKAKKLVRIEGLDRVQAALSAGRGVVGVTAHLGNYELAGAVLSLAGIPVHAAVLSHQNRKVDEFFTRQRDRVGVRGLPIQRIGRKAFLAGALEALRSNHFLGLVGDRDFFDRGMEVPLFGRSCKIPTGPAAFAFRTGAPIVPCFLVREKGGYRLLLEPPIRIRQDLAREEAIPLATRECTEVLARYIRRYATQWYLFQPFWRPAPAVIQ